MKTITLITLFVGALAFITNAYASVSANMSVSSDYLWRGDSLSGGDAVVQGGLDYETDLLYAGIWVSTLGNGNGEEVDLYVGTSLGIDGLDLGVVKYEINSLEDTEIYAGYSIGDFSLYYAQSEEDSDIDFMSLSYGFDISESISASLTYGEWSDEAVAALGVNSDYLQLDLSYGNMTFTVLDAEDREDLDVAVSYSFDL